MASAKLEPVCSVESCTSYTRLDPCVDRYGNIFCSAGCLNTFYDGAPPDPVSFSTAWGRVLARARSDQR